MTTIATTPDPPYWAVIFTSFRSDVDDGYDQAAARMVEHREVQRLGREEWYSSFRTRIGRVEREYGMPG